MIVVDNSSTDDTDEMASGYADKLDMQVLSASGRSSAPYARNVGARAARGEIIVFIDADDVADADLIAAYTAQCEGYEIMGGRYEESRLNDAEVASWRYELTNGSLPLAFGAFSFFLMGNCAITCGFPPTAMRWLRVTLRSLARRSSVRWMALRFAASSTWRGG